MIYGRYNGINKNIPTGVALLQTLISIYIECMDRVGVFVLPYIVY